MKLIKIYLIINTILFTLIIITSYNKVSANFATFECKHDNTELAPYFNLVLVDLSDISNSTEDVQEFYKELFYEFIYIYKSKTVPLNGIFFDAKVYPYGCNMIDSQVLNVSNKPKNSMIAGLIKQEDLSTLHLQTLIDKYHFSRIYTANLVRGNDDFSLTNLTEYQSDNIKLYKDPLKYRHYNIKVDVEYPKEIDPQTEGTVKLLIQNNSNLPIPPKQYKSLLIKSLTKNSLSDLYNKEWIGLKEVGIINDEYIWPNEVIDYSFKIGPYLLPKSHKDSFALFYGTDRLDSTDFTISFKVKDKHLHLVKIEPKTYKFANVHKSPGLNTEVIFKLDPGEVVIYLKKENAWVYIETVDHRKGWVYYPFVKEIKK